VIKPQFCYPIILFDSSARVVSTYIWFTPKYLFNWSKKQTIELTFPWFRKLQLSSTLLSRLDWIWWICCSL